MKKILALIFCLAAFFIIIVIFVKIRPASPPKKVESFHRCVELGYKVEESYPRGCRTPDGKLFYETLEEKNMPQIESNYEHK